MHSVTNENYFGFMRTMPEVDTILTPLMQYLLSLFFLFVLDFALSLLLMTCHKLECQSDFTDDDDQTNEHITEGTASGKPSTSWWRYLLPFHYFMWNLFQIFFIRSIFHSNFLFQKFIKSKSRLFAHLSNGNQFAMQVSDYFKILAFGHSAHFRLIFFLLFSRFWTQSRS